MRHPQRSSPFALALLLGAAACAAPASPTGPAAADAGPSAETRPLTPGEGLETFDAAWTAIDETHFDPTFNGVDWAAVGQELRPRAASAESVDELRAVIREMVGRLDQSHFALMPAELLDRRDGSGEDSDGDAAEAGRPGTGEDAERGEPEAHVGIDLRLRARALLVSDVIPGSPADGAGVRPGWRLVGVDGFEIDDVLARFDEAEELDPREIAYSVRQRALARLQGEPGTTVTLELEDGEGSRRELELERVRPDAVREDFGGSLPAMDLYFEAEEVEGQGVRVGRIHFTNWFLPMVGPVDEAMDRFRELDGIVIDLRGNGGGAMPMVMGFAGHFFDQRVDLGVMHTRNAPLKLFANPRRVDSQGRPTRPFAGPLALLVDETSASASEVFAGGMQSLGRGHVVGETTMGAVLPARTTFLPNGDALLHAMGDFVTPDGTLLEGRGVVPNETVPLRRADLLDGRDPQLEAAIAWIASRTTSQP